MYKFLTVIFIFLLLITQQTFAVDTLPEKTVSFEPVDAKVGEPIKLMALIYNGQKEDIVFTVSFKVGDSTIEKPIVVSIDSMSAETVSIDWKQPEKQTQVNVVVTSAVDKKRQDLTSLHGVVGYILVGNKDVNNDFGLGDISIPKGKAQEIFSSIRDRLEKFRVKEASHFSDLRDKTKIKLHINVSEDVYEKLTPSISNTNTDESTELSYLESENLDNPLDYGTLIYSTALASLFSSVIMFYAALVLLSFLVLRFIFRIFF